MKSYEHATPALRKDQRKLTVAILELPTRCLMGSPMTPSAWLRGLKVVLSLSIVYLRFWELDLSRSTENETSAPPLTIPIVSVRCRHTQL